MQSEIKKGFVTVATGSESYYILAYNLLLSYRYQSKSPMPFGILCDRHNVWTEAFDEVVIIDNPANSFADKLRILDLSPFDETIFVDADCLAYRDLNGLWEFFSDSPDVGLLGRSFPAESEYGWWKAENLGELRDFVEFKNVCQGGVYFVRNNGKDLPAIKETCQFIANHYLDYHFSIFEDVPEDETILCLAAAVHHIVPVLEWNVLFAYYPEALGLSANIRKGHLRYMWKDGTGEPNTTAYLIHFGTRNTFLPNSDGLYNREIYRLRYRPYWHKEVKDSVVLCIRNLVNKSPVCHTLANLFPKELRNKYNKMDFRGSLHG